MPIALYLAACAAVTLVGLGLGRDPQPDEVEELLAHSAVGGDRTQTAS